MSKIFTVKLANNTLTIKIATNYIVNLRELETIKKGEIELFLRPVSFENDVEPILRYDISGLNTLYNYLQSGTTQTKFASVCKQLVSLNEIIKEKYLHTQNVIAHVGQIYINENTGKIYFIYLPVSGIEETNELSDLFADLPYYAVFSRNESRKYVQNYINFFEENISFSVWNYVKMLDGISHQDNLKANAEKTEPPQQFAAPESRSVVSSKKKKAYLVDANGFKFAIQGTILTIGKSQTNNFVISEPQVSRNHAVIKYDGTNYYITDNYSTNKTFLNNAELKPNELYRIKNGDRIRFVNINYIFREE